MTQRPIPPRRVEVKQRVGLGLRHNDATADTAAPRRGEDDPARGKLVRIEIVVRPVGQLSEPPGVQVESEHAPDVRIGRGGQQQLRGVVAEFQAREVGGQFLALPRSGSHLHAGQRLFDRGFRLEVSDDDRPAAFAVPPITGPSLLDDPVVAGLLEHADDIVEVQQRIGQRDLSPQPADLHEDRLASVGVGRRGGLGRQRAQPSLEPVEHFHRDPLPVAMVLHQGGRSSQDNLQGVLVFRQRKGLSIERLRLDAVPQHVLHSTVLSPILQPFDLPGQFLIFIVPNIRQVPARDRFGP